MIANTIRTSNVSPLYLAPTVIASRTTGYRNSLILDFRQVDDRRGDSDFTDRVIKVARMALHFSDTKAAQI